MNPMTSVGSVTRAGRVGSRSLDLGFQWNEPAYLLMISMRIHDGIYGIGVGTALARARVYVRPDATRNRYYVPCFPVGAKRPTKMGCRAKAVGEVIRNRTEEF